MSRLLFLGCTTRTMLWLRIISVGKDVSKCEPSNVVLKIFRNFPRRKIPTPQNLYIPVFTLCYFHNVS